MARPISWYTPLDKKTLTIKEIALFGMLGGLTFGAKFVMSGLPNIEPVSLLLMLFAVTFGVKALFPMGIYIALEILIYGIQLWNINYLYVWPLLLLVALSMRKVTSPLLWAIVAAVFGLFFGLLCAPVYLFTGGLAFAVNWWLSGIPFDLLHCVGNFVIVLLLFAPLRKLLGNLYRKYIL